MAEDEGEDEEMWLDDDGESEGDGFEENQPKPSWPLNITIPDKAELEGLNELGSEE
jgi:hypothetical protein